VTEVVRLTLISHAMTDALAAGRFPADEPINDTGRHLVEAVAAFEFVGHTRQLTGPERRARQTAQLLGLQAATEPRLADLDCGRWRGEVLANIGPADLEAWLTEPAHTPHGGESIADLIDRVDGWLDSLTDDALRTVAVTHPAVIRAAILLALDTQAKSFWRIDIAPLSQTVMHFRGGRWTLRL
jgi:broad specificity phosphatase PhoE